MKINDTLSGAALAALGVTILVHVQSFPPMPGQKVGPAMFPGILATGLIICALILVKRGLSTVRTGGLIEWPAWIAQKRIALGFALIPVVLVVYAAVSEKLGFLPTAVAFLFALFLVYGVRLRVAVAMALAGSLGIHYVFYKLLKVPLPWGILKPFAW